MFCFFLGFGSFVEKTVMPYISTTPAKLLNPCTADQNCTSPFSYKNVLSLTENGQRFNSLVSQQQISGNLDSPEGGFDAIMQVAVCGVSLLLRLNGNSNGLFPVVMPCPWIQVRDSHCLHNKLKQPNNPEGIALNE